MLAGLSVLHYVEYLGIVGTVAPSTHFGLTRHAVDRILFLIPVIYAGYTLRLRVGLGICFAALVIMLPRALFISPSPPDALLETGGILVVGTLTCFWFEAQLKAKEQRQQASRELEAIQVDLQTHIRLSRSNEKRLATLNAISGMLSRSLDLEELLSSALDMVMDVMEVEAALIFSLDEESSLLRLMAYDGVSDRFAQGVDRIKLGEGFNGLVAQTGEPLQVEDASHDPRLTKQVVREEKIQAQLIVPLRVKGMITGTLCVANRRPRHFLPEEVELLIAIGNQIGIAIDNSRLYQKQQLIAAQYQSIFANASDAIWVHDLEGNILTANEAAARLTGYSLEELLRLKVMDFLPEKGLESAREVRDKLLQREAINEPYDQRLIRKDGTEALLRLSSSLIRTDGEPVGFQHIARDVTKERQMEENLRYYIQAVTRAQEEERKRIARELHDETAQQLIALSHQLEDFIRNNERLSLDGVELLRSWHQRLKDTLQGVRWFSRDLRPPMLDDLGLLPALEWLTDQIENESALDVKLKVIGTQRRLAPEAELLLFRIIQEALNNVRRHAEASMVEVTVEFDEGRVLTIVRDNGKGFELSKAVGDLSRTGKLGLIGMEERARLLGAKLTIQSELGRGTTVAVEAPI